VERVAGVGSMRKGKGGEGLIFKGVDELVVGGVAN
jgi:hypothetical protein